MSITVDYKVLSLQKSEADEKFRKQCLNFADALTADYFWQNEEFNLQHVPSDIGHQDSKAAREFIHYISEAVQEKCAAILARANFMSLLSDGSTARKTRSEKELVLIRTERAGLSCLSGSTNVGENISDEWYIVYILFQISKKFNDLVIQVNDDDGEFLLIESAEHLPPWLKPSFSQNRVFISNGDIHIIPFPSNPAEIAHFPTHTPSFMKALKLVLGSHVTKASKEIQQAIQNRIKCYPSKVYEDFHHVHCYIPDSVIYVLYKKPKLVARIVQAFYERDHLDVKVCKNMKTFDPDMRRLALVKFTRQLYSQISQANFFPDRSSSWRLPLRHDRNYKAALLGFKLTCGFEIILSRAVETLDSKTNQEASGRLWEEFLEQLKKRDYFQNEMEGSKRYTELLMQAKSHFIEQVQSKKRESCSVSGTIRSLIDEASTHGAKIQEWCTNLPAEDDDSWMTVTPDEMDDMMKNLWKPGSSPQTDVKNMANLIDNMKQFVNNISSYEGAEVHRQADDDGGDIEFDPDEFMNTVRTLLEPPSECQADLDDEDEVATASDSDEGEEDVAVREAMQQMDSELKTTSIPKSFTANKDEELDVDFNLVKNFLESFSSQDGLSGPVSSILQSIGMTLPPDGDR